MTDEKERPTPLLLVRMVSGQAYVIDQAKAVFEARWIAALEAIDTPALTLITTETVGGPDITLAGEGIESVHQIWPGNTRYEHAVAERARRERAEIERLRESAS